MARVAADEKPSSTVKPRGASTESTILGQLVGQRSDGVERRRAGTSVASGEGSGADLGSEPAGSSLSTHSEGTKPWTRCS